MVCLAFPRAISTFAQRKIKLIKAFADERGLVAPSSLTTTVRVDVLEEIKHQCTDEIMVMKHPTPSTI